LAIPPFGDQRHRPIFKTAAQQHRGDAGRDLSASAASDDQLVQITAIGDRHEVILVLESPTG
jgi:hypothetical protein